MQEPWIAAEPGRVERVAVVSMHTCPLDQPGTGDSGGMNVVVRSVARRLAEMGLAVDVFTRRAGAEQGVVQMDEGVRCIHLPAGPPRPVRKEELPSHLPAFLCEVLRFAAAEADAWGEAHRYDVVHSHYWLSGWAGRLLRHRWGIPLVHTFHTLGAVKNRRLARGEPPEPEERIAAEQRVVQAADCILVPTAGEAAELVNFYGARPGRVRVISPGVDGELFRPGDRAAARAAVGAGERPLVLFVGRLQPLKAPDLAVRALAELAARRPHLDPQLAIIGGPSGSAGVTPISLEKLAAELGVAERVMLVPPLPHERLVQWYRAADAVLVPSHTESFGLVALEASACGTPVVASDVGGLRTTVRDGATGILVAGRAPERFADALARTLEDPALARTLGAAGARFARRFDWRRAASGMLEVYEEMAARASEPPERAAEPVPCPE